MLIYLEHDIDQRNGLLLFWYQFAWGDNSFQ